MREILAWLFLIACALLVVWGVADDYRWRAHRVDDWAKVGATELFPEVFGDDR